MTVPEELSRAYAQGDLIVCVGPGPSVQVGLPSAKQLAGALLRHAADVDESIDVAALLPRIDSGRAAEVLQLAARTLGASFQREVERRWSDEGISPPPLVAAIAQRRGSLRAVYSVRLDRLLERGFAGRWPAFATARPDLAQRRELLWKIFGTIEMPGTWVLTQAQVQAELGPGSARSETFATAYRAHQMLFVGFSPNDAELAALLELAPAAEAGHGPGHFIALPECSPSDRALLEGRGLQVVVSDPVALFESLGGETEAPAPAPSVETCPYVADAPMQEEHAPLFFGRHAEVSEAASQVGPSRRWLSVEGAGGIGKSSFVNAGVLPALRLGFSDDDASRWLVARVSARAGHVRGLVRALAETLELDDEAVLAEAIADSGERFAKFLELHVPRGAVLVVLFDPLDALLQDAPDERDTVCDRLAAGLRRGQLYLVTTLRSDRVADAEQALGALSSMLVGDAVRVALRPMSRVGLREVILEPAARAGATIEAELVEQVIADADAGGGRSDEGPVRTAAPTLAIVARTMAGLWTREVIDDRVITLDEYRAMGGVRAAIRRTAQGTLSSLDGDRSAGAQALLAALVDERNGVRLARRRLDIDEARGIAGEDVVDALAVGAAVLSIDEVGEVSIVHDDLARDWSSMMASSSVVAALPATKGRSWAWIAVPAVAALIGVVAFVGLGSDAKDDDVVAGDPQSGPKTPPPKPNHDDPDPPPKDGPRIDVGAKKLDLGTPVAEEDGAPGEEGQDPGLPVADGEEPTDPGGVSSSPAKPGKPKKTCYLDPSGSKIKSYRSSDWNCEPANTAKKLAGCKKIYSCRPRRKI